MPPKLRPRRVRSEEDRNKGRGNFITLSKAGQQFLGYALGVADPELDDNPGYYELFEHYTPATGYCPCASDDDNDCPLCEQGDNPSTRAKMLFLVVEDEDQDVSDGEVKIFNLNWGTLQEFAEDGSDALGQLYRVKRQDDRGNYSIRVKTAKLTKTQLKAILKEVDDDFLEKLAQKQLNRVLEQLEVADAMEDDDDDDDDDEDAKSEKSKSKSRKRNAKEEPEDDEPTASSEFDPEEDDAFEGNVTVVKINKSKNIATVEDGNGAEFALYGTDDIDVKGASKGETYTASAGKDEDGDFVLDMWEEVTENGDDEPAASGDVPDEIDGDSVTITKVNGDPEFTLQVETEDDEEFELFFLGNGEDENGRDWDEFDIDDYSVGDKIVISAKRDEDGDMVATVFPEKAGGKSKGKSKAKAGKGRK